MKLSVDEVFARGNVLTEDWQISESKAFNNEQIVSAVCWRESLKTAVC